MEKQIKLKYPTAAEPTIGMPSGETHVRGEAPAQGEPKGETEAKS